MLGIEIHSKKNKYYGNQWLLTDLFFIFWVNYSFKFQTWRVLTKMAHKLTWEQLLHDPVELNDPF